MKKHIDCLLIGHNDIDFEEYEKKVRAMGVRSGAYRDLDLNFVVLDNRPQTAADMFNLFYGGDSNGGSPKYPLTTGETFSATIAYLGTYLHRRGFGFDFVNSFQEEKEELALKLSGHSIDLVAITTTLYVSMLPILEIVEFIRKHNPETRIAVGGPFISTRTRVQDDGALEFMFNSIGADFYVDSSQGEGTLVRLLGALQGNGNVQDVPNLHYRAGAGYTSTPKVVEDNRLAENMVDWNLFAGRVGDFANLRTSISCPFSCAFCGFPEHAGHYQVAGIGDIERELTVLDSVHSLKCVHFIDDTFNVPKQRFKDMLRMMIQRRFTFNWYSHFRCQFADRETVELMKESGCDGVFLGIESGSPSVLESMNKQATAEKYLEGIALLKEYGITTYGSFIVGFPGETEATARETRQFINSSGLDFFRAQLWYYEPITPIRRRRERFGLEGESFEWRHHTMDSATASDIVDDMFLSSGEPLWVPQYNFECDAIFHLQHRGLPRRRVKDFIQAFNRGVREKITGQGRREIGAETLDDMRRAVCGDIHPQCEPEPIQTMEADFDF